MFRWLSNKRPLRFAVLPGLALAAVCAPTARGDEVEEFLKRLGLADLRLMYVEQSVERQETAEDRRREAMRLADLYAQRLMTAGADQLLYDDVSRRIAALIESTPEAGTPALCVMLLQADYNRAETKIVQWTNNPADEQALAEARGILQRIAPQLRRFQQALRDEVEKGYDQLDEFDEQALQDADSQLERQEMLAARAGYFAGWSSYYCGLSQPGSEAAQAEFSAARKLFRDLLGIFDDDDLEKVGAAALDLTSAWRARALIGLGLAEAALGDTAASRRCFEILDDPDTPPVLRDQAPYWRLTALLRAGKLAEAHGFAAAQIESLTGPATAGKALFCTAIARAGLTGAAPQSRPLAELGMRGLAKLREFSLADQLLDQYDFTLQNEDGFYLRWMKGRQLLARAEQSRSADQFQAAAETFSAALRQEGAARDVVSSGYCRERLAICLFNLEEYESAAREFEQAATMMGEAAPEQAVQSLWNAFIAYRKLAADKPRFTAQAARVLTTLKRDFPQSDQAKKVDFHMARLSSPSANVAETIRALQSVKRDSPNYADAQFELCSLRHQQWKQARGKQEQEAAAAAQLLQVVDHFLSAAGAGDDARRLQCALFAAEAALRQSSGATETAAAYLDKVGGFAERAASTSSVIAEYHFRRLQIAQKLADTAQQQRRAAWLSQNAAGTIYETPALVVLARLADRAVVEAATSERQQRLTEALNVYGRLAEKLGETTQAMQQDKNALAAASQLAHYEFELGRVGEAAARLERMLEAYPRDRRFLRRAALAQQQRGDLTAALAHWRTLLSGVEKNSDGWYEAKYHQLEILLRTDRDSAEQVWRQFQLLHPQVKSAAWREKFEELKTKFST